MEFSQHEMKTDMEIMEEFEKFREFLHQRNLSVANLELHAYEDDMFESDMPVKTIHVDTLMGGLTMKHHNR